MCAGGTSPKEQAQGAWAGRQEPRRHHQGSARATAAAACAQRRRLRRPGPSEVHLTTRPGAGGRASTERCGCPSITPAAERCSQAPPGRPHMSVLVPQQVLLLHNLMLGECNMHTG